LDRFGQVTVFWGVALAQGAPNAKNVAGKKVWALVAQRMA